MGRVENENKGYKTERNMSKIALYNAKIVTGKRVGMGTVVIDGNRISSVAWDERDERCKTEEVLSEKESDKACNGTEKDASEKDQTIKFDLEGKLVLAGGIDEHVHFREPGLTHKADMGTESLAGLFGGTTTFMDMPNTIPQTVDLEEVESKVALAEGRSYANYGFYIGATNDNYEALVRAVENDGDKFAGIKIFMGSSTGKMKVNDPEVLDKLFSIRGKPILVHCEDDEIIAQNLEAMRLKYGSLTPVNMHPYIRSREACINSTKLALELALRHGTRLHILHVSTAEEVEMIARAKDRNPLITAETTINYLWFSEKDYERLGGQIKCNPAIKAESDRLRLIEALREGTIDTIGTDHAPHLWEEKFGRPSGTPLSADENPNPLDYSSIPSGIPCNQHTLPVLLTLADRYGIPLERIASAFSERPAEILGITDRGHLETGGVADLVFVDPNAEWTVSQEELKYKCGWSPYVGEKLKGRVDGVVVNGKSPKQPIGKRIIFK